MAGRPRSSRLSATEQAEVWRRFHLGETISGITRELGCSYSRLDRLIHQHGGVRPAPCKRSGRHLTLADREEISRGISMGETLEEMAERIGKAKSTVSREVKRNGGRVHYRAARADEAAWARARRPQCCKLAGNPRLCRSVARGLLKKWSPQQISQRLEEQFPNDQSMRVSHETIYRSLFIQARGVLKKELTQHLRRGQSMRRARKASTAGHEPTRIAEGLSIRERPAEVEDRAVPGHWEGDLISGYRSASHIATLVERHSRFVMLVKIPNKEADGVARALAKKMRKLPAELRRSLTWDRGSELAAHKDFTLESDMQVYFCDPRSPWQRGSNENTNGLLRQYFPKGTDLSVHSQAHLNAVAAELNGRPRQTLSFKTPAEKLAEFVALTG
jgi:IS30 family transposase